MPKQPTDFLLQLIKSMSKPEKRHFKLFVQRNPSNSDSLFLRLFAHLEKQQSYDEIKTLSQIPEIKKQQLPNLKAHLYKQLLLSLRLIHRSDNEDIDIRERIDYARILYNKGLYRQSLEMLARAKEKCQSLGFPSLLMEIIDFEKLIESQYITRSIANRAEALSNEAIRTAEEIMRIQKYSNLSLQLYALYLKVGYVRNEKDHFLVKEFFQSHKLTDHEDSLGFYEHLYLYQSYVWHSYMLLDFKLYYRYSQKWISLFDSHENMIMLERPLYLKGMHNLLNALFLLQRHDKFMVSLQLLLINLKKYPARNENDKSLEFIYTYTHKINQHYLEGTFNQGLPLVQDIMSAIKTNVFHLDFHRIILFYYKIACLYFGSGDNSQAIDYLNMIVNESPDFRGDIQCYARILRVIAYYEMGDNYLVEYQVKSIYRFLIKMDDLHAVQKEILSFIRKLPRVQTSDLKREFKKLLDRLNRLKSDPYEQRSFLYLDIISWLESKIQGVPVQTIIKDKFLKKSKRKLA
ncbi:MAG: hypothetical protein IPJ09_05140 [Saprospiraceae bacterium]|nr:hypothetical protein [Saprospiraceae bacterium]